MFKFGDKVAVVINDKIIIKEALVLRIYDNPQYVKILTNEIIFESGLKDLLNVGAIDFNEPQSFYIYRSHINNLKSLKPKKVEQVNESKENIDDQIDLLRHAMNNIYLKQKTEIQPEKEQITTTVEAKFGGEHEAKLAEPLKEVTLNLTNKSFKKHKPNKLRKLIKKTIKKEIAKIFKNKVKYIYKTEGIRNE